MCGVLRRVVYESTGKRRNDNNLELVDCEFYKMKRKSKLSWIAQMDTFQMVKRHNVIFIKSINYVLITLYIICCSN